MQKPPCMVWLPADHRLLGAGSQAMPFLILGDKYARAVKESVGAQPVMFPLADAAQVAQLLPLVHGVMLTGSPARSAAVMLAAPAGSAPMRRVVGE